MQILVVKDGQCQELGRAFEAAGFNVTMASGRDFVVPGVAFDNQSAIVLDLDLLSIDGISLLKRWRRTGMSTPVLAISARGLREDALEALDVGADDYISKPFSTAEIIARLRAVIRRSVRSRREIAVFEDIVLDFEQIQVWMSGEPIAFAPLEFRLLSYLMKNCGQVFRQKALEMQLDSKVIPVLIARIRKKLRPGIIETLPGIGYLCRAKVESQSYLAYR
jgi:two-component system OmpR family response regulator